MLAVFSRQVLARPARCVGAWMVVAAVLMVTAPTSERAARSEALSLIPPDEPYNLSLEFERRAFADLSFRTRTVLVYERGTGLTPADFAYFAELTGRLQRDVAAGEQRRVQSPTAQPYLRRRLLSDDGCAAMIVVNTRANYVTHRSVREVEAIEATARHDLPAGLDLEITGEGGLGRDLGIETARAFERTTWVTVLAVLAILAVVYRAPLAALVPLTSISLSVVMAIVLLNWLAVAGWPIGDAEKTFTVVLLFGSGTDFALLWMARYREEVGRTTSRRMAAADALTATAPAVVASAGTTIVGLTMLLFADLLPSHNAGLALALALSVSLLAALTLVPALAYILGGALFWPHRRIPQRRDHGAGWWARGAYAVTRRPGWVAAVPIALLIAPILYGATLHYRYDTLGYVPRDSSSARGRATLERHFAASQLFSWAFMVTSPRLDTAPQSARALSADLSQRCRMIDGVADVWSLATPLGQRGGGEVTGMLAATFGIEQVAPYYVSRDPPTLRWEIMQTGAPLSDVMMASCGEVLEEVRRWSRVQIDPDALVHATGLTPYIRNIRSVSEADQDRVMVLVTLAIAAVVMVWLRDPAMTVCMLTATLGIYLATLGVTQLFFVHVLGGAGIDGKVRLFLFVILMAVGQDYNIFLLSRLREERRRCETGEAVRRAVVSTGAVISCCGLVMATTLGSLSATGLPLLQQLGFAFACGIALDTFVVRPLLIPAVYLLIERRRSRRVVAGTGRRSDLV